MVVCDDHDGGGSWAVYADNLFVFTITLTFALVAPLLMPVSFLFFFGAFVVYKRQILFVYEPVSQHLPHPTPTDWCVFPGQTRLARLSGREPP